MKHKLYVGLLCIVLLLNIAGCANSSSQLPHPVINVPGGCMESLEVILPEKLAKNINESAILYELDTSIANAMEQIEHSFDIVLQDAKMYSAAGFDVYEFEDCRVMIDQETAYWTYEKYEQDATPSNAITIEAITDEEAKKIAVNFLDENELWAGEFHDIITTHRTSGGWTSDEVIEETKIYFYPKIDEDAVLGVFRIVVTIDKSGNIVSVYKLLNNIKSTQTVPTIGNSVIQEKLESKNYSPSFSEELTNIEITGCKVQYYADNCLNMGKAYIYPVVVLFGSGITANGDLSSFDIIIDAIA